MNRRKLAFVLLLLGFGFANAQQRQEDSLLAVINAHSADTTGVDALMSLAGRVKDDSLASGYVQRGLALAKKLHYRNGEALGFMTLAYVADNHGNFSASVQYTLDALSVYKELHNDVGVASSHLHLQAIYREAGDYKSSLIHAFEGEQLAAAKNIKGLNGFQGHRLAPLFLAEIGQTYVLMKRLDSAAFYTQKSIDEKEIFAGAEWEFPFYLLATIQNLQGNYTAALKNYRKSLWLTIRNEIPWDTLQVYAGMSTMFRNTGDFDSAIHYAKLVASGWTSESEYKNFLEALDNLAQVYKEKGQADSALKYTEIRNTIKDSIFSGESNREVQRITFAETLKQKELAASQLRYKNKVQLYTFVAGIFILLLIAGLLWRHNRQQLKSQYKIEKAYAELKAAQAQLIQSEKMASLGELTAGIAHEIQNPLNFINNFSDVNAELIEDLQAELATGNGQEAIAIADDIKENEQKINHHGKRADAIVKGMLQHSRTSSGKKEPTDINALADEYLRLSYHGFRAKDKDFNVTKETSFDESIGKIEVVPQDIGRVLLNLYNNAFYAASLPSPVKNGIDAGGFNEGQKPAVWVTTKSDGKKVIISVGDNGPGIPDKVVDKIFQPFFTTKPTGQGTGLGLSLSYDIIKANGGELKVETEEGKGAQFIIHLPLSNNS